jgi:hypothetical protein
VTLWEGQDFTVEEGIDALSRAALTPAPESELAQGEQKSWRDDLGALHVERNLPVGILEYVAADAGQWLTKQGEPARKPKSGYTLYPNGKDDTGVEMDRVSKVLDCLHKPALLRWFEDHGIRGGAKAHALGELDDLPEEDWAERVRFLELGAEAQRDKAASRGTGVHDLLERLAKGQTVVRDSLAADARPFYDGAIGAWMQLDPELDGAEVEQIICHPLDIYAGRPDFVGVVTAFGKRCRTVVDYKTSPKGRVFAEAHYQGALYERARRFCGFEPAERIIIVGVDENGGYTLSEGLVDDSEAEALLRLFRSKQRVERALNDQRRAA